MESIRQSRQSESSSPDGLIHGRLVYEPPGHPRTRGELGYRRSNLKNRSSLATTSLTTRQPKSTASIRDIADIRPGRARLEGLDCRRQTGGVDWLPFFFGAFGSSREPIWGRLGDAWLASWPCTVAGDSVASFASDGRGIPITESV
jgi:hypothetical protein